MARYIWADGSIEISNYDQDGIQNGQAKLTWPNGAIREGSKVKLGIKLLFIFRTIFTESCNLPISKMY